MSEKSIHDFQKLSLIYDTVEKMASCGIVDKDSHQLASFFPNTGSSYCGLSEKDFGIIVAGEISGGKTTFINTLIGEEGLFKTSIHASTTRITRIRNSDQLRVKTYSKDNVLMSGGKPLADLQTLRNEIEKINHCGNLPGNSGERIRYIDVYLQVPILKGNAVIVDTPGVGDNDIHDDIVLDLLPKAAVFVFVVNVRNAGGMHADRIGKIIRTVKEKQEKIHRFDISNVLFLTNQWDCIECSIFPPVEVKENVQLIWEKTKEAIKDEWKDLLMENIFQISLKQVQQCKEKTYTSDYDRLLIMLEQKVIDIQNNAVPWFIDFVIDFYYRANVSTFARLQMPYKYAEKLKISNETKSESRTESEEEYKKRMAEQKKVFKKLAESIDKQIDKFERYRITEEIVGKDHRGKSQGFSFKMSTSQEEPIKDLKEIFDDAQEMVTSAAYRNYLEKELSKTEGYSDCMEAFDTYNSDLSLSDCSIVVAGETSAGKTTFVNTLVEKAGLFKSSIRASTAIITRIRNSSKICVKACTKNNTITWEKDFQDLEELKNEMQNLSDLSNRPDLMENGTYYIDVYLPVTILKGNVIIVDTPGVGETEKLDEVIREYLPKAVAYVFIVNTRNAGGIKEDRIGKLLKTVSENLQKMRCFNVSDAFFLTNQWDSVADALFASSNPEKEIEELWDTTRKVIMETMKGLPLENIFQISLKQVHGYVLEPESEETQYIREYKRFEDQLSETINRTQYKRVSTYFELICNFHERAKIETLFKMRRLEQREMWKTKFKDMLDKTDSEIKNLKEKNKKSRKEMESCIRETVHELSEELKKYMDESRDEILNPVEEPEIAEIRRWNISNEVHCRVQRGIEKWTEKPQTIEIIRRAEQRIQEITQSINMELKNIAGNLVGKGTMGLAATITGLGVWLSVLSLQFSLALSVFIGVLIGPVLAAAGTISLVFMNNGFDVKTMAQTKYKQIIDKISTKKMMEETIGKELQTIVSRIFYVEMPQKIATILKIKQQLEKEFMSENQERESKDIESVNNEMESMKALKTRIDKIEERIKKFRDEYSN